MNLMTKSSRDILEKDTIISLDKERTLIQIQKL